MISKAVIAAAGKGTRMLPFSLSIAKELIPIGRVPVLQYVLEELFESGIFELIIVISKDKQAIVEYLDISNQNDSLRLYKDKKLLNRMERFVYNLKKSTITYIYQNPSDGYGNAIPLLLAAPKLKNEPIIYTWADDFISSSPTRFSQLIDTYEATGNTVLSGVNACHDEDYEKYAYVDAREVSSGLYKLKQIYEKPGKVSAPSQLGVLSGHLFAPSVLRYTKKAYQEHQEGEFLFNDIVHMAIKNNEDVMVQLIKNGVFNDTGNVDSYVETIIRQHEIFKT